MAKLSKKELLQAIINITWKWTLNEKEADQALIEIKLLLENHGLLK